MCDKYIHHGVEVEAREEHLGVTSYHHMSPGDRTQVVRPCSKHFTVRHLREQAVLNLRGNVPGPFL